MPHSLVEWYTHNSRYKVPSSSTGVFHYRSAMLRRFVLSNTKAIVPARWAATAARRQQHFSSGASAHHLASLLGEELDEEEEILATMEHNDIDRVLAVLRTDFTKIDIEHGSPLIKMEKVHGADTKIAITCDVEDQHVYEEDEEEVGYWIDVALERKNTTLGFRVELLGDTVLVENVKIQDSSQVGTSDPPTYDGPKFVDWEDHLQDAILDYLEEVGIGPQFAVNMSSLIRVKEQTEYIRYLDRFQLFVSN